ncbi:MAG: HAMP domain-containing protein, partial [Desulfobulbaceae bacterium]|nr:HAMP domain-containing protein [Desulfobulbaceae bacterium]
MKNLKLGFKLIGGFAMTALLVLIVGLFALYAESGLKTQLQYITRDILPATQNMLVMQNEVIEIRAYTSLLLSNYLSAEDREEAERLIAESRKTHATAQENFLALDTAKLTQDEWRRNDEATKANVKVNNQIIGYSQELLKMGVLNPFRLRNNLNHIEIDHKDLVSNVASYVAGGHAFDGGTDPTTCALGKWMDHPETTNPLLIEMIATIRPMHKEFHESVARIKTLVSQGGGQAEALRLLENELRPLSVRLFAELAKGREVSAKASDTFRTMSTVMLKEGQTSLAGMQVAIDALQKKIDAISDEAVAKAEAGAKRGHLITIICMVVGVALALGLGYFLTRIITGPLFKSVGLANTIASGDLTQTVDIDQKDEVGVLAKSLNDMAANLRQMFGDIQRGVDNVDGASNQLAALSGQMSSGSEATASLSGQVAAAAEEMSSNQNTIAAAMEQASVNVNMVATAAEEMSATINEIASNSAKAKDITSEAVEQSKKASERVGELGNAADEINKVTEVITEISEQTNLLALNAT